MKATHYTAVPNDATQISNPFETRDFYLACFLRNIGYELIELGVEGRRRVFKFRDIARRRADVMAFYSDRAAVHPLAFSSTIKDMKALLHNA